MHNNFLRTSGKEGLMWQGAASQRAMAGRSAVEKERQKPAEAMKHKAARALEYRVAKAIGASSGLWWLGLPGVLGLLATFGASQMLQFCIVLLGQGAVAEVSRDNF